MYFFPQSLIFVITLAYAYAQPRIVLPDNDERRREC